MVYTFRIGTHIVSDRIVYSHHGIYIGKDQVIEYGSLAKISDTAKIRIVTLSEFCGGNSPYIYKFDSHLKGKRYSNTEIVRRAKSRLNEEGYNLIFNNCEHFANWCTHGDDYSTQACGIAERNVRSGNYFTTGIDLRDLIQLFKKLF